MACRERQTVSKIYGLVLVVTLLTTVLSSRATLAAGNAAQGDSSAALETSSEPDADFLATVTSEADASNREMADARPRGTDSGSLLLMEIRTHHGSAGAASVKAAILDLDPRTKPLGW